MLVAGKFQLVAELGRGAFGVVYEARDTYLDRTVALKTIRTEVFTSAAEAADFEQRFLREARAAAALQHPNIITIYEAGRDGATSYMAMELVRGTTLRDLLRERGRLLLAEVMPIAEALLSALQEAHDHGIVHRDVKPENVMIREDGCLKVADFGIAKALHANTANLTRDGAILGTPAYMAPEQIAGRKLDGRADVFSAAALLYETLAGGKPFDAETMPSLVHQILTATPPPLETRVAVPAAVGEALARGLAKEPDERWDSARSFLGALRAAAGPARGRGDAVTVMDAHALPTRAVTIPTRAATVPTRAVRTASAEPERGGRGGLLIAGGAAAVLVLLLIVVAAAVSIYYVMAKRAREEAWRRHSQEGETAYKKGDYAAAERELLAAVAMAQGFGSSDPRLWRSENDLGSVYEAKGDGAKAEDVYKRALQIRERVLGPEHPDVASSVDAVGRSLTSQGKWGEAEGYWRRALTIREKVLGPSHRETGSSDMALGWTLLNLNRPVEAEPLYRKSLAIREKELGANSVDTAWSAWGVGLCLFQQNRFTEAEPFYRRCLDIRKVQLGPMNADLAFAYYSLGLTLFREGKNADAEAPLRQSLTIRQSTIGEQLDTAWAAYYLGSVYFQQKRWKESEPLMRRAVAIRQKLLRPDDGDLALAVHDLGAALGNMNRFQEAEVFYRQALPVLEKAYGTESTSVAQCLHNMGVAYNNLRYYSNAIAALRRSMAIREKALGTQSAEYLACKEALRYAEQNGRSASAYAPPAAPPGGMPMP